MIAADLTEIARQRQADPAKLTRLLHGDLDWIVMKALEKDRSRRYETANGLAMDVQRYMTDEPVLARPPSSLYRFKKMVRRHRLGFAVASAVMATLFFVMIFWLVKVVPVIAECMVLRNPELRDRKLPALMQFVIDLSHFMGRWGLLIFMVGGGGLYGFWKMRRK